MIPHPLRGHHDMPYMAEEHDPVWNIIKNVKGDLAFDIGANIGQASAILAQNFVSVVALEPCEASYEVLAAEMPANVMALPRAVSDTTGVVRLMATESHEPLGELVSLDSVAGQQMRFIGHVEVSSITVDDLVAEFGIPDFIKIDTEGHEMKVLAGANATLVSSMSELLIEVHSAAFEVPIAHLMDELGYEWTLIRHHPRVGQQIVDNHFWIHAWRGDE